MVRLGDSSPGGRARLDAIARHLQDISDDDARAAGFGDFTWVVRRTAIAVHAFPSYVEPLQLRTWCSGFGAAWAERRITMTGEPASPIYFQNFSFSIAVASVCHQLIKGAVS